MRYPKLDRLRKWRKGTGRWAGDSGQGSTLEEALRNRNYNSKVLPSRTRRESRACAGYPATHSTRDSFATSHFAQHLRVMTWNILSEHLNELFSFQFVELPEGYGDWLGWERREGMIVEEIRRYSRGS